MIDAQALLSEMRRRFPEPPGHRHHLTLEPLTGKLAIGIWCHREFCAHLIFENDEETVQYDAIATGVREVLEQFLREHA